MTAERLVVAEPLGAGEVLAATFREYGRKPLTYVAIGVVEALAGLTTYSGTGIPLGAGLLIVAIAFVGCLAVATAVASGWSWPEIRARLRNSIGALIGLVLVVGVPATLGRVDAILTVLAILWLAVAAFAVPVVICDQRLGRSVGLSSVLTALKRSHTLAQTAFLHALGVIFILFVVTVLITSLLAAALGNFGDQGELAAFVISRAVLVPIIFIGITVLYFDHRQRFAEAVGPGGGGEQDAVERSR